MNGEITLLLGRLRAGDGHAESLLYEAVYAELKRIARHRLRLEGRRHTLQTTDLVHEAYIKLLGAAALDWQDRRHFYRVASLAMKQILVDYARARLAQKRGGGAEIVPLIDSIIDRSRLSAVDIMVLDEALDRFERLDARAHEVFLLRVLVGLSVEDTASVLEIAPRTVKRDYRSARAWLNAELDSGVSDHATGVAAS